MLLPWQCTFHHCQKMCIAHLHFKTKVCAKINLKTPFPTIFGIMCRYHGNERTFHQVKKYVPLHIYTSRPTSVPIFISNALFSSIFGIMCRYHGNTLSATVKKCVLHIYTQRQTSVPNSMRIGQKLRK